MKYFFTVLSVFLLISCGSHCEVCNLMKGIDVIETYESCDAEEIKAFKIKCNGTARLIEFECNCTKK